MPHVATMGTSSCACIAIGGFNNGDSQTVNEEYKAEGVIPETSGHSIQFFYDEVLYPITQPLGRTKDLPFEKLMEDIDASSLSTKLIAATLNLHQYHESGMYWHNELKRWGFELVTKTDNVIGTVNYIYFRNPSYIPIEDGEV